MMSKIKGELKVLRSRRYGLALTRLQTLVLKALKCNGFVIQKRKLVDSLKLSVDAVP
ncbi:MAG: hypothetical protein AAFY20_16245 [Cyanobacteria bacterium J06639_14]